MKKLILALVLISSGSAFAAGNVCYRCEATDTLSVVNLKKVKSNGSLSYEEQVQMCTSMRECKQIIKDTDKTDCSARAAETND